jgi:hypothetical protein
MNVLEFSSSDEMKQHLANAARHGLHPVQEALTWGSTWVQFPVTGKHYMRWGLVLTKDTLMDRCLERGLTTEQAREQVQGAERAQADGVLYVRRHQFYRSPEGIETVAYKAHVWPVEEALFLAASEADFYTTRLPASQQVNLQAAHLAWREHMRSKR